MNRKTVGLLAGSLLATIALAPPGLAHDDSGGTTVNRVSGNYVGSAHPRAWAYNPNDPYDWLADLYAPYVIPRVCDLEVMSDGDFSTLDNFLDEPKADGYATGGTTQPEGTWDDGGLGVVCHTPNTHYTTMALNTQGCDYEPAFANDLVLGPNVWIYAGCDWLTTFTYPPDPRFSDFVLSTADCTVSASDTNLPLNPLGGVNEALFGCADRFTDCTINVGLDSDSCPVLTIDGSACGPDGFNDAGGNFGVGGHGVAFPTTYPYYNYPGMGQDGYCASTDGVANVWVLDGVVIDTDAGLVTPYVATTGQVW